MCQQKNAVVVRYFKDGKVVFRFLSLTGVKDSSAEGLFQTIIGFFHENKININNLLGLAADKASVMQGNKLLCTQFN